MKNLWTVSGRVLRPAFIHGATLAIPGFAPI